jgi:hypothetical protein
MKRRRIKKFNTFDTVFSRAQSGNQFVHKEPTNLQESGEADEGKAKD